MLSELTHVSTAFADPTPAFGAPSLVPADAVRLYNNLHCYMLLFSTSYPESLTFALY